MKRRPEPEMMNHGVLSLLRGLVLHKWWNDPLLKGVPAVELGQCGSLWFYDSYKGQRGRFAKIIRQHVWMNLWDVSLYEQKSKGGDCGFKKCKTFDNPEAAVEVAVAWITKQGTRKRRNTLGGLGGDR
jgi:hypothetical protein